MTGTLCDICGNIMPSKKVHGTQIEIGGKIEKINICEKCKRRDREAPGKYIRKHFAASRGVKVTRDKILKTAETIEKISQRGVGVGGVLERLAKELRAVRKLLFLPKFPLKGVSVEERREEAIAKLVKAIDVVENLAKRAKTTSEKSKADTTKARYYHLLGYLVQVLDSILRSVTLDEIKQHVDETDKEIVKLKREVAEAEARARAVKTEARGDSEPRAAA